MTWFDAVWFSTGLVLGIAHTAGIWHSANRPTMLTALWGVTRLLLIGLALSAAAIFGGILPAAAGWTAGFFGGIGILKLRAHTKVTI